MKTIKILAVAAAAMMSLVGCDKPNEVIEYASLPTAAKTFITDHFATLSVASVIKDVDTFETSYQVRFSNGTTIEFNGSGEWEDVDCINTRVPDAIVPTAILDYVNADYPSNFIVEIGRDRHYDIELNNTLELDFSLDGKFIRIDD